MNNDYEEHVDVFGMLLDKYKNMQTFLDIFLGLFLMDFSS